MNNNREGYVVKAKLSANPRPRPARTVLRPSPKTRIVKTSQKVRKEQMPKNLMQLVKNKKVYWGFIRELRSDDRIQDGFIQKVKITKEQQASYMEKHNDNYWICLCDGYPAGFVGNIDGDIRVAVHPMFQRKGIGKFMINELMKKNNGHAKIKINNEASLALFRACGFKDKYIILEKE